MKVFFSLTLFSLVLAACKACYVVDFESMHKGKVRIPNTCVDVYNGRVYPIGSIWIAEDCYQCRCSETGMFCCHRNFREIPECKVVLNRHTCEPEYYRLDDVSQRCDV